MDSELKELVNNGILSATTDFQFVKDIDIVLICVPTPLMNISNQILVM